MSNPIQVDEQGRLQIPKDVQHELNVQPGDTFYLQRQGYVLCFSKSENPFDILANQALKQHDAGETISIETLLKDPEYKISENE